MEKQNGAVLVVALIFLLLITAIAASLMTSGSFETKIAGNKQERENIFHIAESAVDQVIPNDAAFTSAFNANGAPFNANVLLKALPATDSDKQYGVVVEWLNQQRQAFGQSLNAGGKYEMYEVRSTAQTTDIPPRLSTELVLGLARFRQGPGGGSPYDP